MNEINTYQLFTLGHSNQKWQDFLQILLHYKIEVLIDIRSIPKSRFECFDGQKIREALIDQPIEYHWAGKQLGGMRKPSQNSIHSALENPHMKAFADYMDSDLFKKSINQLVSMAKQQTLAIMCAERDPKHCHRRLISDYLNLQGVEVIHILDINNSFTHQISPQVRRESQTLIYDRFESGFLFNH